MSLLKSENPPVAAFSSYSLHKSLKPGHLDQLNIWKTAGLWYVLGVRSKDCVCDGRMLCLDLSHLIMMGKL